MNWVEQGFFVSAAILAVCLIGAWLWPRMDT